MMRQMKNTFFVLLIMLMSFNIEAAGCKGLANFVDLALNKSMSPSKALELAKRVHSLEQASDLKIVDDGQDVAIKVEGYADGKLLYRRDGNDEVLSFDILENDIDALFKRAEEPSAVAASDDVISAGDDTAEVAADIVPDYVKVAEEADGGPGITSVTGRVDASDAKLVESPDVEISLSSITTDISAPKNLDEIPSFSAFDDATPVIRSNVDTPVLRPQGPASRLDPIAPERALVVREPSLPAVRPEAVTAPKAPSGDLVVRDPSLPAVRPDTPVVRPQGPTSRLEPIAPDRALVVRDPSLPAVRPDAVGAPKAPGGALVVRDPSLPAIRPETPVVRPQGPASRLEPIAPDRAIVLRQNTLPARPVEVVAEGPKALPAPEPVRALPAPATRIDAIKVAGETPLQPAAPRLESAPRVDVDSTRRVVPGRGNFPDDIVDKVISFTSPAGTKPTRGRVIDINNESVVIKTDKGVETVRFRNIDSTTLRIEEGAVIGRPSQGIARPGRADFEGLNPGDSVAFTAPGGGAPKFGKFVRLNNQSIILEVMVDGKLVEKPFRFRDINRDSIALRATVPRNRAVVVRGGSGEIPAIPAEVPAVAGSRDIAEATGREVVPYVHTGEVLEGGSDVARAEPIAGKLESPVIEGSLAEPAITLESSRAVAKVEPSTDVVPFVHQGDLVDGATDVVKAEPIAGRIESPYIDGSLADSAPRIRTPRRLENFEVARVGKAPEGVPDNFAAFFKEGYQVSFKTKDGVNVSGTFKRIDGEYAIFEGTDGSIFRIRLADIDDLSIVSRLSPWTTSAREFDELIKGDYVIDFKYGDDIADAVGGTKENIRTTTDSMRFFENLGKGPFRIVERGRDFIKILGKGMRSPKRVSLSALKRNRVAISARRLLNSGYETARAAGRVANERDEGDERTAVDNGELSPGPGDDEGDRTETDGEPTPTPTPTPENNNDEGYRDYDNGDGDEEEEDEVLPPPAPSQRRQGPGRRPFQPAPTHKSGIQIKQGVF